MNDYLEKVLRKQCEMVGADFKGVNVEKDDWFLQYSWTEEQQEEFVAWLIKELSKSIKMRRAILDHPNITSKKHLEQAARMFTLCYGWRLKG